MEFFEALNPVFESSLKFNNKTEFTDNKRKTLCFSSFMDKALSSNKYDKKKNYLVRNRVQEDSYMNESYKLDKANNIDEIEASNILKDNNIKTETKEKINIINEQTDWEEIELKDEGLKKLLESLANLLNFDGEDMAYLQQILKFYEHSLLDIRALENNLDNKVETVLNNFEFHRINTIQEAISFLNLLLYEHEDAKDIKNFLDGIPEDAKLKELLAYSSKSVKAEPQKITVLQDRDSKIGLLKMNLNPSFSYVEDEYANEEEASNKRDLLQSDKNINFIEEGPQKLHQTELEEPNKVFIKDLELEFPASDENLSAIVGTTKLQQKKPETIMEQQRIQKNYILEQVIDRVKFITKEEFSELKVQLQPENLGKLTLKLILDKGEMTARFIAENNHVKEVIESNFSGLKDALCEKGINIQNLSVSVGQDGRWFNDKTGFRAWKNSIKHSNNRLKDLCDEEIAYVLNGDNPYYFKEGILDIKV